MMSDLVRQDTLLGGPKTVIGSVNQDMVLETLGTLYIKLLNTFVDIMDYISNQILSTLNTFEKIDIVNDINKQLPEDYGDGSFIFDSKTQRLYFKLNNKFNLISDLLQNQANDMFVRRDGSVSMINPLVINSGNAPLVVTSSLEVNKLNANYLLGYKAESFAKKAQDEKITGQWTFSKNIVALGNIRQTGDLITDGSLGSPIFISGMNGAGWKLDSTTNTLTIDNLIVRGILSVFELVVNKITATNGSLWVTDAFKAGSVTKVKEINLEELLGTEETVSTIDISRLLDITNLEVGQYIIFYYDGFNRTIISNRKPSYYNTGDIKENIDYYVYSKIYRLKKKIEISLTLTLALSEEYLVEEELYGTETVYKNDSSTLEKTTVTLFEKFNNALFNFIPSKEVLNYKFTLKDALGKNNIKNLYLYYSYFGNNSIYVITPEKDKEYPSFHSGDILLCQKFDGQNIKKYNSIVLTTSQYGVVILMAGSVLDYYTSTKYDSLGNLLEFISERLADDDKVGIALPSEGDALVRIGNIFDPSRRGSLYLTSSEQDNPRIDIMDGVCRPDYSVLYYTPKYEKFKNSTYEYYAQKSGSIPIYNTKQEWAVNPNNSELIGCRYITGNEVLVQSGQGQYIAEIVSNTKTRLGNLNNIYNELFENKLPYGYGLYGDNVFLTGEFYLNNGISLMDISDAITLGTGTKESLATLKTKLENFDQGIADGVSNYLDTHGDQIVSLLEDLVQDLVESNTGTFLHSVTKLVEDSKGIATASSMALASGRAGITLTGLTYVQNTFQTLEAANAYCENNGYPQGAFNVGDRIPNTESFEVSSDSSIGLIADKVHIDNYITDSGYSLILYTTQSISNWTSDTTWKYGWILGTPNASNTVFLETPYTFKVLKTGTTETCSTSVYYKSAAEAVYKDSSNGGTKFLEADRTDSNKEPQICYYVLVKKTSALFSQGKIAAEYIDAKAIAVESLVATVSSNKKDTNPITENKPATDESHDDPDNFVNSKALPYTIINGITGKMFVNGGEVSVTSEDSQVLIDASDASIKIGNRDNKEIITINGTVNNNISIPTQSFTDKKSFLILDNSFTNLSLPKISVLEKDNSSLNNGYIGTGSVSYSLRIATNEITVTESCNFIALGLCDVHTVTCTLGNSPSGAENAGQSTNFTGISIGECTYKVLDKNNNEATILNTGNYNVCVNIPITITYITTTLGSYASPANNVDWPITINVSHTGTTYPEFSYCLVPVSLEMFNTNIFGNGVTINYDKNNYWMSYTKDANLITSYKSRGIGLEVSGGNRWNLLKDFYLPLFIPVLHFTIIPTGENSLSYNFIFPNSNASYSNISGVISTTETPYKYISEESGTRISWDVKGKAYLKASLVKPASKNLIFTINLVGLVWRLIFGVSNDSAISLSNTTARIISTPVYAKDATEATENAGITTLSGNNSIRFVLDTLKNVGLQGSLEVIL